jgi:hypothetical protein
MIENKLNEPASTQPTDKKRCGINGCKRNIELMAVTCKCGKTICFRHRDPLLHDCTFDFRAERTKELTRTLVKVEADRMGTRL